MSDSDSGYGPRLAAYLDAVNDTSSMRRFLGAEQAAWVTEWRKGVAPSIGRMRAIADHLEVPLAEVLLHAGYGTPEDFGGAQPRDLTPPDVQAAIAADTAISEDGKQILLAMYRQLAGVVDEAPKPRTRRPVKVKDIRRGRS